MKNDTRTLIGQLLKQQKKIAPLVPSIDPDYRKDTSIKALIFDIYGTLTDLFVGGRNRLEGHSRKPENCP